VLALAAEGTLQPPAKRFRVGNSAGIGRPGVGIEEPLASYSDEAVAALLTFVYNPQPSAAKTLVAEAVGGKRRHLLDELVRLADQLDVAPIVAAAEGALFDALPANAPTMEVQAWLPALLLADAHSQQLPAFYCAALLTASRVAVAALDSKGGSATPLQIFLSSPASFKLSQ
jgi:hypothetical protein